MQAGIHPFLDNLGAEDTRCGFGDFPFKNQLDTVRASHIQIVPDNGLEPLPALHRVCKDLGATKLSLPDGEPVVKASLLVLGCQTPGQACLPFFQKV